MSSKKKRDYIAVNIPRKWERYLREALENSEIQKELEIAQLRKTASSLGRWIIRQFLVDKTSFHFEHLNTYENRATIADNKIRRIIDIYPRPIGQSEFELWCEYCKSTDCEHIKYAVTLAAIMKPLAKEGRKYKEE